MLRLYDWRCEGCYREYEFTVEVPHGEKVPTEVQRTCEECMAVMPHKRLMPLTAVYLGERLRNATNFNPSVAGGRFDTMGRRAAPALPDIQGAAEVEEKVSNAIAALPDNATRKDANAVIQDVVKDAPKVEDYREHFKTPEYKEAKAQRLKTLRENKAKRKRAELIAKGETSIRAMPLPGDPKEAHKQ